jgi:hypothetical protein
MFEFLLSPHAFFFTRLVFEFLVSLHVPSFTKLLFQFLVLNMSKILANMFFFQFLLPPCVTKYIFEFHVSLHVLSVTKRLPCFSARAKFYRIYISVSCSFALPSVFLSFFFFARAECYQTCVSLYCFSACVKCYYFCSCFSSLAKCYQTSITVSCSSACYQMYFSVFYFLPHAVYYQISCVIKYIVPSFLSCDACYQTSALASPHVRLQFWFFLICFIKNRKNNMRPKDC